MPGQYFFQARQIVVGKWMRQLPNRPGNARIACSAADVPILPAVISATRNPVASSESARSPHRARRCVRSVFSEAHHLGARNQTRESLSELHFEWMGQRKAVPFGQLSGHGGIYFFVRVSEDVRQQPLHVIDVLVAVYIPDATAFAALQKNWRHALHVLRVSLAESLGATGNDFF